MALSLFGERKRRRSRRRSSEKKTVSKLGLFGERKRRRSRSRRRSHEPVVKLGERKRRRSRSRRRSREPVRLFGAERKRRRSRSRRRSRHLFGAERKRRRSRSRRRSLRLFGGERKRRRSRSRRAPRRRSRSRRRSRELSLFGLGERKRRRSRSRRRSYEPSRGLRLGERKRRRSRSRRRSREPGIRFLPRMRNGEFVDDVLKPGAIAAVGLVGTRLLSQWVGRATANILPASIGPTIGKWLPTAIAGASAFGVYYAAKRIRPLRPYKSVLAIGAGLAVVEEFLAVLLPTIGLTPGTAGIGGSLANALYGVDSGMGFPCFTGACPQGVMLPQNQIPCDPNGTMNTYAMPGQYQTVAPVVPNGTAGMGFPCFTGNCPQGVMLPNQQIPCDPNGTATVYTTNGQTAAQVAVASSGFTDPVAQQVLAGLSGRAQEILNGAGIR